ncbi:MAG: hypothetical protein WDK96_02055 [Candidatus Paceibacterota bacterium]|jgi:hypothetical protein
MFIFKKTKNKTKSEYGFIQHQIYSENKFGAGFSLMETVLYSGMLSVFLVISITFFNSIAKADNASLARKEIIANQEMVDKKIQWIINQSTAVTSPIIGTPDHTLSFSGLVSGVYPASFTLTSEKVNLSLNNGTPVPITNDSVKVTNFNVEYFDAVQSKPTIKVSLNLQSVISQSINSSTIFYYVLP